MDLYRSKDYKESPLLDQWSNLVKQVSEAHYEGNEFEAALRLIHATAVFKETRRSPPQYSMCDYREGIEVMNLLFDVINELAGYSNKYYKELTDQIDNEGLIAKYS